MDLSSVIMQMAVLLIVILIGYAAAKAKIFPTDTNRVLSQIVIYVTNPCTVLFAALGGERMLDNCQVLLLTVIAVAMYGVLIGLGFVLPRLLACPREDRNLYHFMCVFSNMGFLGFPVVSALYGPNAVFFASIFNLVLQFIGYTYGDSLLNPNANGWRSELKNLCSPIIIASILAYICYLTDVKAPKLVLSTLQLLANVTSGLSMLVIGIALASVPLGKVFTNWRLYVINLVRLLLLPAGAFLLLRPLVENQLVLGITVVMAGMPVATLTTLLTAKFNGNQQLAAAGVFLSTLLSFITIPLLMWIMF